LALAWPSNEIAVMGAEGAANVIFRREINAADDPEAVRQQKIKEYQVELMHPYYAAERGLVDDVIDPRQTRRIIIRSLAMLRHK
ncbi:methylmalonyl-CoA carboxyltransferase, partial [Streptomyces sp. SID8455]|nr:methylmalonyl-CoA carboxyltransferase [Streptomyces sp. SID8455]